MLKRNLKVNICKLCFNTKCNFKVVEEIKEVLEIVLPKLSLEEGDKHLICSSCSVKLFAAFNFKSVCTDTEDTIFPYVNSQEMPLADLKEIYLKEKGDIQSIDILENQKICRLCFQSVGYGFVSLNEVDADIIDNYIPEVNFNATKDSVICKLCSDSLITHGTFLSSCLAVQEENRKVCDSPAEDRECCIKTEETKIEDDWERKVCGDPAEDRECCIKTEDIKIEDDCDRKVCGDPAEDSECCIKTEEIKIEDDCDSDLPTNPEHTEMIKNFDGRFSSENKPVEYKKHLLGKVQQTYTCNRCNFKTMYKSNLKRHCLSHVPLTPTHISLKSQNESENRDTSSPYLLENQERMFQCEKCPYRTHRRDKFARHWSTHEVPSEVKVYQCEKCYYRVTRKYTFRLHQLRHEDSAIKYKNHPPGNVRTYTCNICEFKTLQKYRMKRHCLRHKVFPTPTYTSPKSQCKSENRDASLPCTLKHEKERMYQCEKCPYRTHVREAFITHWSTHEVPSEVKVYQCDKCHYRVTQANHFRRHQLRHKDGGIVEKYTCEKCDFQTRYKPSLVTHQLLHKKEKLENIKCHTGDDGQLIYECNVCKYETKNRRLLLVHRCHQMNPTKQLKFKCHMCAYQSDDKDKLMRHQGKHNSGMKTLKCDLCSFQTIWKSNLVRHQLRHGKNAK